MPTVMQSVESNGPVQAKAERKLTGLRVLVILLLFFGTVAAVDGVMIYGALSTFRGEVVSHPYEKGLAFDSEIARAREQDARGWKVDGAVKREADGKAHINVTAHDAAGAALTGLKVHVTLAAPADMKRDEPIELVEAGGGVYRGEALTRPGVWDFDMTASRDGKPMFRSRNRITLQ